MWFTGIDWADDHHDVHVLDEAGHSLTQLRVAHSFEGLERLINELTRICGPDQKAQMICVLELKSGLVVTALQQAGFTLYPVNPKTVDRWRSPAGAKTDQIDARALAKVARSDWQDLHPLSVPHASLLELHELVRDQQGLLREHTRLCNQLKACLKAYYPLILDSFASDVSQKSTLAFLQAYPRPQTLQGVSAEQIEAVLKAARHTQAPQAAQRIWQQMQSPKLVADEATTRAKARLMLALISQLGLLDEHIKSYDEAIAQLYEQQEDSQLFESLPGAGKRLAPRLLAELGQFDVQSVDVRGIQRVAGTVPVCKQSGKSRQVSQRLACIKPLRDALYLFGLQSIKQVHWAKE